MTFLNRKSFNSIFTGGQVHFLTKAGQGDPDYQDFWNRHQSGVEQTMYIKIEEALGLLRNDRIIMHVNDQALRNYFNANPFFHQNLYFFARQRPFFGGLITTKISPLSPIFKRVATLLRERSVTDKIIKAWVGKKLRSTTEVEKMVVGVGQVVLAMVVMGAVVGVALVFLCVEITWKGFST